MQELAHSVYIETGYAGVTLGAINWSHGLILIDAPFRPDDTRSWRSALLNLGGGVDRMLVNLDAHFDRTLGARAMECIVVSHEKVAEIFRNRPVTFKTQGSETGAEWELYNGLGSIRWVPPEITFNEGMVIHWDESPLRLEHHPGPSIGATWAVMPNQHIVFVGDAIVPDQPPFLASANLPDWIKTLSALVSPEFQDYLIVSGRGGLVAMQQVRRQIHFLEKANQMMMELVARKAPVSETESLVDPLLSDFAFSPQREILFRQRIRYGLRQYYARHFQSGGEEFAD
jgi:glyoxylase-like metal-dependent hydrolase (beta-lactamase superfamily II)